VNLITVKKLRVNKAIKVKEVRLIDAEGEQIGVIPIKDAMDMAEKAGTDLVEVNPNSTPPVCKILDYGKYRYELSKKEKESKLNRKNMELREVKFRLKIDTHDYEVKKKMIRRLLGEGDKVKVTLMFVGREVVYKKSGVEKLNELANELQEIATMEKLPKGEGKNMVMILAPKVKN
jgi:translation initiation factor IF-3